MKNVFFSPGWLEGTHSISFSSLGEGLRTRLKRNPGFWLSLDQLACALAIPRHKFVFEGIEAARLVIN